MSRARDTANQINRINSSAADATAITVDSSENVGIGTSSIDGTLHLDSGTSTDLIIEKDNAGSGTLRFHNDGSQVSYIELDASEDMVYYGASGVNQIFYSGGSERMRILDGGGITFNGDTASANALNDYEEGTWTPTVGGNAAYSVQTGSYTKVGNLVFIYGEMRISSMGTGTVNFLSGLPFNGNREHTINISKLVNSTTNVYWANLRTSASSLYLAYQNALDGTWTNNPSFLTTSTEIQFSGTYLTDA